jgi:transposase InsO family protein
MAGYYRRFVPNFSQLSAPLTDLITKKGKIQWTVDAEQAFKEIKKRLMTAPILVTPKWDQMFTIHTDASDYAVGAMLTQGEGDDERPIAYMSRKLVHAQVNYTTTEKECLAILLAVKHFRCYVDGVLFKVITDHAALKWLNSLDVKSGRLARWIAELSQYDYIVEHRKGPLHVIPDALSRIDNAPEPEVVYVVNDVQEPQDGKASKMADKTEIVASEMADKDEIDPEYTRLMKDIQNCPKGYQGYRVFNGKIYRFDKTLKLTDESLRWKEMVPNSQTKKIISLHHDTPLSPHLGFAKTYEKVKVKYWWPSMGKDIREYLNNCEICGKIKAPNYNITAPLKSHQIPTRKFDVLCIDFATELPRSKRGNTCFFVGVDLLTKYPIGYASRQADGKTMIQFMAEKFMEFGVPKMVISDNGKQFVSKEFKHFLETWKVTHKTTPYYHPQANPAERVVKSIKGAIRAFAMDRHTTWDEHLHEFLGALRAHVHESTKFSPYFVTFGQEMSLTGERSPVMADTDQKLETREQIAETSNKIIKAARNNIRHAQRRQKINYDKTTAQRVFNVGEMVYRRNFKQSNKLEKYSQKLGPKYMKTEIIGKDGDTYMTRDLTGKIGKYHANHLKPATTVVTRSRAKAAKSE